jgi:hypothetical protein
MWMSLFCRGGDSVGRSVLAHCSDLEACGEAGPGAPRFYFLPRETRRTMSSAAPSAVTEVTLT